MCKCFLIASSESVAPLWTAPMMMFRREPVGAAVSDGSLRTDHISSGRLGGPAAMRAESRAYRSGVERDDADDVCARSALADLVRDVRLRGHERAGDGPERVDGQCPGRDLWWSRKSRVGSSVLGSRPSVVRCGCGWPCGRTAVERRSRCVPLSRVALRRLGRSQSAAT
jgi:hypothetical protein